MEQEKLKLLFESIKKDDLKSFSFIMVSKGDLNISFGRFPILSLLYLYGSYNILKVYEKDLMPIHNYKVEPEFFDMYKKFKRSAKKAVRLYQNEECFVYPVEMLAIVDNRFLLSKKYDKLYKNDEIVQNIRKIYNLSDEFEISLDLQNFNINKKKLTFKQKVIGFCLAGVLLFVSLFSGLSILFMGSISGFGTAKSPILIASEAELQAAIRSGDRYYKLENDIVLTKKFNPKNFSGVIDGENFTIYSGEYLVDGLVKNLSGKVLDLNINIEIKNAKIENNFGIIAQNSTGTIENCEIIGSIAGQVSQDEDVNMGGVVAVNDGLIKGCSTSLDVNLSNSGATNVYYSNFVGINNGTVEQCIASTGKIETDTVDVAGIVCTNNGEIINTENYVEISQVSAKEWHPNAAGIVCTNNGLVENVKNHGDVFAESKLEVLPKDSTMYVFVGGISCNNYNKITGSENLGLIFGKGDVSIVCAGGISATNESTDANIALIEKCKSTANIKSESAKTTTYAGGIVALNDAYLEKQETALGYYYMIKNTANIKKCGFVGEIISNSATSYNGGIVAYCYYATVNDSYSDVKFTDDAVAADGNLYVTGAIAGNMMVDSELNLLNYVNNVHYVKKTSDLMAVNVQNTSLNLIYPKNNQSCGATEYQTLGDIPEEIRL